MNRLLGLAIIIGLSVAPARAEAGGISLRNKKITNVIAYDDFVILQFSPAADEGVTGCPKNNQVHLDMNGDRGEPLYAAALTAATAGKTVTLKVQQGSCENLWEAAELYQVNVAF